MKYPHIHSKRIKLWTIQPIAIYEELVEKGEVNVFGSEFANSDPKHLYGYEWLISQMNQRIGESPHPNQYPMWAWFQWLHHNGQMPDMRRYGLAKGEKNVRLTIEMDREDVLLSDFEMWHNVFQFQIPVIHDHNFFKDLSDEDLPYLGYGEVLFPNLSERHQNLIKNTWENIFSLNHGLSWHSKRIQATFWTLKLSDVKKVEYFTGR